MDILLKRGGRANEMTRYRYDVLLEVASPRRPAESIAWQDWSESARGLETIASALASRPSAVGWRGIPNARLETDERVMAWLSGDAGEGASEVAALRRELSSKRTSSVDPESLWQLAEKFGYALQVRSASSGVATHMDAVLRQVAEDDLPPVAWCAKETMVPEKSWPAYANDPLKAHRIRDLVPQLRSHARGRLPDYMVPSAFVVLDCLPLNANGKIDRDALPAPKGQRQLEETYVAPRSSLEEKICDFWQQLLHVNRIGVLDDFFELGGHSLLATQVMSWVRDTFQIDFALATLFERPTVAALAEAIDKLLVEKIAMISEVEAQRLAASSPASR